MISCQEKGEEQNRDAMESRLPRRGYLSRCNIHTCNFLWWVKHFQAPGQTDKKEHTFGPLLGPTVGPSSQKICKPVLRHAVTADGASPGVQELAVPIFLPSDPTFCWQYWLFQRCKPAPWKLGWPLGAHNCCGGQQLGNVLIATQFCSCPPEFGSVGYTNTSVELLQGGACVHDGRTAQYGRMLWASNVSQSLPSSLPHMLPINKFVLSALLSYNISKFRPAYLDPVS